MNKIMDLLFVEAGRARRLPRLGLLGLASITLLSAAGCDRQACQTLTRDHASMMAAQRQAFEDSKEPGPVVMSVSLHQELLEDLLNDALKAKPPSATRTLRAPGGSVKASVKLGSVEAQMTDDCRRCLALNANISVRAQIRVASRTLSEVTLRARALGQVPLNIKTQGDGAVLTAQLDRASLKRLRIDTKALPSWARKPLEDYAASSATSLLKQLGDSFTIARIDPIKVPDVPLRLTPARLETFPKQQELELGFTTNFSTASPKPPADLPASPSLRKGERVAMRFNDQALTSLMNAAFLSKQVPTRLNDDLKPDPKGVNHVTLDRVTPRKGKLQTSFTIWHLPDSGACYAAEVQGMVAAQVKPLAIRSKTRVSASINDLTVVNTRGNDTLLRIGLWIQSTFMDQALKANTRILAADTLKLGPLGERRLKIKRLDVKDDGVVVAGELR